ncbi:hypothetical protein [Actinomadura sp. 7K507]|uniref:hypothetical protein n=1 Tax=Actinomadura sp. 7K507 TaxID=2530365 RepID=UPI001050BCE5|nr:hypothetical protein [Actinomadura sp. 7K507]TDC90777.1 hypothetical protein E1285_14210 [Actinomadura sp. 7K507]
MNDLKAELERLAGSPGPPPAVDVAAAVVAGRRIRLMRRARRAAAVVVAAGAAAAVAVVAVLPSSHEERPDKVVEPPAYPSPLVEEAAFGWLPAGYARTRVTRESGRNPTYEVHAGRGPGGAPIALTVMPPGKRPGIPLLPGARKGRLTKAAPVNGRPAYWSIKPGGPGSEQVAAEFRWEYRPESWALLSVNDRAVADAATVHRVAAGVKFGGNEPVAFPMRVSGIPDGLKVTQTWVGTRPEAMIALGTSRGDDQLTVMLSASRPQARKNFKPNTTIDGHPAFDTRLPHPGPRTGKASNRQTLWVFGVDGFDVNIVAAGEPLRRLQASGGVTGLFRRITPLGTDPAEWTTTPLH